MNSGMRLSVTIIVLVVIGLGLYYASLDDDRVGSGEPPTPATIPAGADSNDSTNVVDETRDPSGDSSPVVPASEPSIPDPVPMPTTPADEPDGVTMDGLQEEAAPTAATSELDAVDADEPTANEDSDVVVAGETQPADAPDNEPESVDDGMGSSDGSPQDGSEVEVAESDAPVDTVDAETDEGFEAGEDESESAPAPREPRLPGRSAIEPGLGAHVIVSIDAAGNLTNASSAIASAEPDLLVITAGDGLAWLAIPSSLRDSKFLASAIVSTKDDTGVEFMLVREDLGGSLSLGGRVAEAEVAGLPGGERFRVRYRVRQEQVDAVLRDSSVLIGQPVAWVVDGGVVGISKPRISISQRSVLPISVDEPTAERLAAGILRSPDEEAPAAAGSSDSEESAASTPASTSGRVAEGVGRPARVGELPADQYTIYVIKPADTPSSIALAWFGDANKYSLILQANPLIDPKLMMPGDEIRLPPRDYELRTIIDVGDGDEPIVHIVQSGENLSGIALAAYGDASLWPRIYEANKSKIKDPSRLDVGTELIIP